MISPARLRVSLVGLDESTVRGDYWLVRTVEMVKAVGKSTISGWFTFSKHGVYQRVQFSLIARSYDREILAAVDAMLVCSSGIHHGGITIMGSAMIHPM